MKCQEQTTIEVSVTTDLLRAYYVSLENNLREMHDFSCHISFFLPGIDCVCGSIPHLTSGPPKRGVVLSDFLRL